METLLYWLAKGLVSFLQSLPLERVARLGRLGGGWFYYLDARHRRVARRNLAQSFPEKSPAEIRAMAQENFRRIGENFACAVKTSVMSAKELEPHLEFPDLRQLEEVFKGRGKAGIIFAIGHFGNFEIYARVAERLPNCQIATTYRALRQPSLNRLMQDIRERSGCLYFERRIEGDALRNAMRKKNIMLGLLADQHGGQRGVRLPFFGRDCSTNPATAVLALRYDLPLFTGFCFRTGLAKWRLEIGTEVPTYANGQPRETEAIMADVNRLFEQAVRRDPTNWFWVHNRWKTPGRPVNPQSNQEPAGAGEAH